MIRYRTRDLTRLLPPSAATSRSMRRIEKITGRSDDMLIIRGVNLFPTQIEELILKQPELEPHYTLEVTRPATSRRVDGACRNGIATGERQPGCAPCRCAKARACDQGLCRVVGERAARYADGDRALDGQGQAHRRSTLG